MVIFKRKVPSSQVPLALFARALSGAEGGRIAALVANVCTAVEERPFRAA